MPKFSVIIPVYSERTEGVTDAEQRHFRGKTVQRAIKSIISQQFKDWELILVDDGCVDDITPRILDAFARDDKRIKVIHKENENRAVARNRGMEEATGEWICWLDSDDEYSTHYLRELNQATFEFPEYKIFNFGSIIHFPDHHTAVRGAYYPIIDGEGHEYFRAGHIGCGSFIFKRELWLKEGLRRTITGEDEEGKPIIVEEVGQVYRIPDRVNPYQFAAASLFDMRFSEEELDIENPAGAFHDGVYRHGLSLGNPWGDDFFQFFLLTRDNHTKPLDVLLYIQYPRAHEEIYTDFGEIYDVD